MKTFEELDLITPVQRALVEEKYETPTPIQAQTIPAALAPEQTGEAVAFASEIY